jgi:hypothetical protein
MRLSEMLIVVALEEFVVECSEMKDGVRILE